MTRGFLGRLGFRLLILGLLVCLNVGVGQTIRAETTQQATSEATAEPTVTPTADLPVEVPEDPTSMPSPEPTTLPENTLEATTTPTDEPVPTTTSQPSQEPTPLSTPTATATSTSTPTQEPTDEASPTPTSGPSPQSTAQPTFTATATLEPSPSAMPTPTSTSSSAEPVPPTFEPEANLEVGYLSGRISTEGRSEGSLVSQIIINENQLAMDTDANGNFAMPDVAFGNYSLTANSRGYLKATCDGVAHGSQLTSVDEVVLLAGDLDDNGLIDVADAVIVGDALGRRGSGQIADLNGDAEVNILDLILTAANFGQTSAGNPWLCQAD